MYIQEGHCILATPSTTSQPFCGKELNALSLEQVYSIKPPTQEWISIEIPT